MRHFHFRAEILIFLALAAAYSLQLITPLRLQFDSIILLSTAETALHGGGLLFHGKPTVFPPGYPVLVALLMKLRVAYLWVLVGINILSLLIGLLALRHVLYPAFLEKRSSVVIVAIFVLLSGVIIPLFTIPLTDFCFFGVAMCCLAVMNSATSRLTVRNIVVNAVLIAVSVSLRRVGIALIPPFVWMLAAHQETRVFVKCLPAKMKFPGILFLTGIVAAVVWEVYSTSTFQAGLLELRLYGADKLLRTPVWRLAELGEIAINVPSSLFSSYVHPVIGLLIALLILKGLLSRRQHPVVVDIFFISYVAVILAWPFYATRFWLPVLPFLIVYAAIPVRRFFQKEICKFAVVAYATLFAIFGVVQLASLTTISISGSRIGDVYRTGVYDKAYCVAGFCRQKPDSTEVADVDRAKRDGMESWWEQDGLRLLCEFRDNKLASGNR